MKKYLILLLFPILAFAGIGKITTLKGDVTVKRDNTVIEAKTGTILEKNDFISTDKSGKVQIVFNDNTIFTIGKNSTLDIADYLYDESQPKKNTAQFNVLKGAFSSITGRIGKLNKSKFKLKTKSASIGIRGTIVKANQTEIMCTEGAITVQTPNGQTVRVEAGEKTTVSSGSPTAPVAITKDEVESMDIEAGAAENGQNGETAEAEAPAAESANVVTNEPDAEPYNEPETRDITLKGRSIGSDGASNKITIDAKNISGELNMGDSGLVITDDAGNAVDSTSNETITWGHWADDPSTKWVAGKQTDAKVLEDMQNDQSKTVNASYSGKVMGSVNGSDDIKMDSTNEVNMNFKLGQNQNTMTGDMKFETQSSQSWNTTFSGSASGNSFETDTISGTGGENAIQDATSTVKGEFYGDDIDAVGGTFKLDTDTDTATGVFKADKQ